MTETAKYTFDRDFEQPAITVEPPEAVVERELRAHYEAEIERVREESFLRGRAEGEREALQSLEGANLGIPRAPGRQLKTTFRARGAGMR